MPWLLPLLQRAKTIEKAAVMSAQRDWEEELKEATAAVHQETDATVKAMRTAGEEQ